MTLTNKILKNISFETDPKFFITKEVTRSLKVFDERIIDFFNEISIYIFNSQKLNNYPDLASFGFFCRKANVKLIKKKYNKFLELRYGRGLVLHFTPSNVPLNFAYSLFFGLITGNSNIIRLSKNNHNQSQILINIVNKILKKKKFFFLSKKIILLRYEKSDEISKYLSSLCDVRLIWGGDNSINQIRKHPLSPSAFDVTFTDKYSICVISSKNYLNSKKFFKEANFFYNDTLFFDQNACTSPKILLWHGNSFEINLAKKIFWKEFEKIIKKKNYNFLKNSVYEKFYKETEAIINLNLDKLKTNSPTIKRLQLKEVPSQIDTFFTPGGFFFEFNFLEFSNIKKFFSSKVQTLTYIGFDPILLNKKLNLDKIKSVDRIVPNGKSSDIGLEWDGYDILFQISKKLDIL